MEKGQEKEVPVQVNQKVEGKKGIVNHNRLRFFL